MSITPAWPAEVLNWLAFGLVLEKSGDADAARQWLDKTRAWIEIERRGGPVELVRGALHHPVDYLEFHILRREAAKFLEPR